MHDELLIEINRRLDVALYNGDAQSIHALRAVVELHSPTPEGRYPKLLCQGCSMTEVNLYAEYPCQTIRIIEKELN
jgi:hypothetical protein